MLLYVSFQAWLSVVVGQRRKHSDVTFLPSLLGEARGTVVSVGQLQL
jgi:hypothetical protein